MIDSLEKECIEAAIKVNEVQNSLQSLTRPQKIKIVKEKLEKFLAKLAIEELEMDHLKTMIGVFGLDFSKNSRIDEYTLSHPIANASLKPFISKFRNLRN